MAYAVGIDILFTADDADGPVDSWFDCQAPTVERGVRRVCMITISVIAHPANLLFRLNNFLSPANFTNFKRIWMQCSAVAASSTSSRLLTFKCHPITQMQNSGVLVTSLIEDKSNPFPVYRCRRGYNLLSRLISNDLDKAALVAPFYVAFQIQANWSHWSGRIPALPNQTLSTRCRSSQQQGILQRQFGAIMDY